MPLDGKKQEQRVSAIASKGKPSKPAAPKPPIPSAASEVDFKAEAAKSVDVDQFSWSKW